MRLSPPVHVLAIALGLMAVAAAPGRLAAQSASRFT